MAKKRKPGRRDGERKAAPAPERVFSSPFKDLKKMLAGRKSSHGEQARGAPAPLPIAAKPAATGARIDRRRIFHAPRARGRAAAPCERQTAGRAFPSTRPPLTRWSMRTRRLSLNCQTWCRDRRRSISPSRTNTSRATASVSTRDSCPASRRRVRHAGSFRHARHDPERRQGSAERVHHRVGA